MGFVRLILVGVFTGIYVRKLSKCIDSRFLEKLYKKADISQSTQEITNFDLDEDLKKLIPLLHFAPKIMIQQLIEKLETIQDTILDI